jgi:hypothetical protein
MSDAEEIWRRKPDTDILTAATCLDEYTDEGRRVILAEARRRGFDVAPLLRAATGCAEPTAADSRRCAYCDSRILYGGRRQGNLRFCSDACRRAGVLLSASREIPDQAVDDRVRSVFDGPCPRCGGPGPVDVHTSHRAVSALPAVDGRGGAGAARGRTGDGRGRRGPELPTGGRDDR